MSALLDLACGDPMTFFLLSALFGYSAFGAGLALYLGLRALWRNL